MNKYQNIAQRLIYPDLRETYQYHNKMISSLARCLENLEKLSNNSECKNITAKSIWEED